MTPLPIPPPDLDERIVIRDAPAPLWRSSVTMSKLSQARAGSGPASAMIGR